MIPNHTDFIEAIRRRKLVRVAFYSVPDHGTIDRECAPLAYAPAPSGNDLSNRYWVWDWACTAGANPLGLLPDQIVTLDTLGTDFDPAAIPRSAAFPAPTAPPADPPPVAVPSPEG